MKKRIELIRILLFIFFFLPQVEVQAQYQLDWVKPFTGNGYRNVTSIVTDSSGNIFSCGYFNGTEDFDPGAGTVSVTSNGNFDVFVLKLDSLGNYIWSITLGGINSDVANWITLDSLGNVLITGNSNSNSVDYDPGSGIIQLTSSGSQNMFVLKLDAMGNFIWADLFAGSTLLSECSSSKIITDDSLNIFVVGNYRGDIDFDPGIINNTYTGIGFYGNPYIAKLNSSGDLIFIKTLEGFGNAWDLTTDSDRNLYVVGNFSDTCDFDPSLNTHELIASGVNSVFILKLSLTGNFIWVKPLEGTGQREISSIKINDQNELFLIGSFTSDIDLDPGVGNQLYNSLGNFDTYILKLDTAGNYVNAKKFGGNGIDVSRYLLLDADGSIFIQGYFDVLMPNTNVDYNPDAGIWNLNNKGSLDLFLVKYNSSLNFEWGASFGGSNVDGNGGIAFHSSNQLIVAGFLSGNNVDLDPTPESALFNAVSFDGFNLRLNLICSTFSEDSVSNCFFYTVPSGNFTYTTSGLYKDTLQNSNGCDSILYINLNINSIDIAVTQNGVQLSANQSGASYQWLDCNSGNTIILGATTQNFTPTINGNYAVEITSNNCKDTSSCYAINNVNVLEQNYEHQIIMYPNPTNENATLEYNTTERGNHSIILTDITGKVVMNENYFAQQGNNSLNLNLNSVEAGMYLITVADANGNQTTLRITKQ